MKNNILVIIFLLCLTIFSSCFSNVYSAENSSQKFRARIYKTNLLGGVVVFNVKTKKYHNPGCTWARKCTQNCIYIKKPEAIQRGGVPCKVCGG
jgi:hypothetical protein